ncbi:MAG: glycosyl hydrolase family 28-related protein, partial [Mangrovibacterium sp.]
MRFPNKLAFLLASVLFLFSCQPQSVSEETAVTEAIIVSQISEPAIPDYSVSVADYGAVGDSVSNSKPAFDEAIEKIKENKGGKVTVPPGIYKLEGPLHLTGNMELNLQKGAKLCFSSDPDDYLPV